MVFICCAIICIIVLMIRRCVVKGELGGDKAGRYCSMILLMSLWFIYIIMSILQAYGIAGLDKLTFGIDPKIKHPNPKCW